MRPVALALGLILAAGAAVHSFTADAIQIRSDDILLMTASAEVAGGDWGRLWAPQHIHFLPLYRLARLPFDLHFPAWHRGFHGLVVSAHLGGALALFLIARRYLRSPWAALAVALLFSGSMVGSEALTWKAASPFVFSWTFLLAGWWCLARPGRAWAAAATAALVCGVGFFSGALFVLPGIVAAAMLLDPAAGRRALRVCAAISVAGALAWAAFVAPQTDLTHYWTHAAPTTPLATRLAWAAADTGRAYLHQLLVGTLLRAQPASAAVFVLLLGLLIFLARRQLHTRLILAGFLLTAPLLFVMLFIRKEPGVSEIGRYAYQSYTLWAILLGALLDAILESWPRRRAAVLALLPVLTAGYLAGHGWIGWQDREAFRRRPTTWAAFWHGWDSFLRLASASRATASRPLVVPHLELDPGLHLATVYGLCHPRGLPGLAVYDRASTAEELTEFWQAVAAARERSTFFRQVELPHAHAF